MRHDQDDSKCGAGCAVRQGIAYAEARMIIVFKQSFATNTDPEGKNHKLFFGEILSVWVRIDN